MEDSLYLDHYQPVFSHLTKHESAMLLDPEKESLITTAQYIYDRDSRSIRFPQKEDQSPRTSPKVKPKDVPARLRLYR